MTKSMKTSNVTVYMYLYDAQSITEYSGYSIVQEKSINGRTFAERADTRSRIEIGHEPGNIFESSRDLAVLWLEEPDYEKALELFGDYIYATIPYFVRNSEHFKALICGNQEMDQYRLLEQLR